MKLKTWIITVLMAVSTASLIQQVEAAQTPEGPHLVTSGTGYVEAIPDMATLSIQVSQVANSQY